MQLEELKQYIREIPDFPKKGILFKDVTPLLGNGAAFRATTTLLAERVASLKAELVVACEARGFLFGAAVAHELGIGIVPVRKPGKLPWRTRRIDYALEYGTDSLEMHHDALDHHKRVVVLDDLLATGGTAAATAKLCAEQGAQVLACLFVIELSFLGGRAKLAPHPVDALITY
jgi:adenine phosphoribosyltransferase